MKRKLLLAAFVVAGALGMRAQTDVTSTYITNAGFETSPIFDGTSLGSGSDPKSNATPTDGSQLKEEAVNVYEISGWTDMTSVTTDFARVFTMPYNTTLYVNGNNSVAGQAVAAPANGSSVTESNNSVLFVEANWCQNAVLGIKQTKNLPEGIYKLTFDSYVTNTLDNAMSLCGIRIGDVTTYKWPTTKDTWTNNEIYFTLSTATDVEFSMGYKKLGNVGGGGSAFLFVDNLKLVQIKNTAAAAPTDVTATIANANASSAWSSPWAHAGNLQDNVNMNNGYDGNKGFFEPSKWGDNSWAGTMYTDLTGLSNGLYILKAAVQSADGVHTRLIAGTSNSSEYPANGTTNGTIAADGSVVTAGSGVDGWNFGSTSAWVTNGTLRIGVYTAAWAKQKWTNIDNFTLSYIPSSEFLGLNDYKSLLSQSQEEAVALLANLEYDNVTGPLRDNLTTSSTKSAAEETIPAYDALISEVNNAINDFTSAKEGYDAFVTEKAIATEVGVTTFPTPTTAAEAWEAINTLKVAEYNYVVGKYDTDGSALFIPTWEKDNFDALSNEHWSAKTSEYFDKWSGSAFTSKIYKTVTLPQGHYAFYAAARGQANASTATLKVSYGETNLSVPYNIKGNRGYGINTSGAADFSSSSTYACNNAGFGWEWRFITFELAAETEVTLSIEGSGNNSWVSAGDTKLLTYDNIAVTRQNYEAALAAAKAYQDTDMFTEDKEELNSAITNNTLTVNEATKDQLTTATENLNAATEKASADAARYATYTTAVNTINGGTNVDLTSIIVNPSFENGLEGWTNTGNMVTQTNTSFGKTGDKYLEFWQPDGTKGVSQTISALPAGIYQVSVRAIARGVTSAKVFANSTEKALTIEDKENNYIVTFEIADKSAITIGFEGVGTGAGASWLALDNFQLEYLGTIDDLTYALATGKMGTDKSDAQEAAEATFLGEKNLANYNALLTAISEAEASVANYANLKRIIDIAEGELAGTNFVTAATKATLEEVVAANTTAWENETYTDQQAKDKAGEIKWHISNYLGSTWITPDPKPEVWWYINTWSTEGDTDGTDFFNPFFENFKSNTENLPTNTFTATLTDLDEGCYEVELWARVQRRSDADFNADNSMITMSVNGGDAVSIMSNTSNNVGTGVSVMRLGRYTATGFVTDDGTLTLSIDVKLGSNVHWLSWRDVKYTKLDEATMSITDAQYATFCAPFAVAIPSGVTAYTVPNATGATLNLTTVEGGTIPANTPVVLFSESTVNETFYGKAVDYDDLVEGLLTGVYEETAAPVGSYVLQNNNGKVAFYLVKENKQPTVGANRAYLTDGSGSAKARAYFFDEKDASAIEAISALTAGEVETIYNAAGVEVKSLQKGMNIVVLKNGQTQKVFVK